MRGGGGGLVDVWVTIVWEFFYIIFLFSFVRAKGILYLFLSQHHAEGLPIASIEVLCIDGRNYSRWRGKCRALSLVAKTCSNICRPSTRLFGPATSGLVGSTRGTCGGQEGRA